MQGLPERGDAIERWLKAVRDCFDHPDDRASYITVDSLLNEYREAADEGRLPA